MLQVQFDYPVNERMLKVIASCKSVVNEEYVESLSITFLDSDDVVVKIEYDKDMFDDIEGEALIMLADLYFNPELNFATH